MDNDKKDRENSKKNKKNKKTIITIEEEVIGPYYVKNKKNYYSSKDSSKTKDDTRTKREKELDAKALESIRRKAIEEIESDDTTANQKIDAGWRLLYSYGFEGNELQKSWKWFHGGF